VHASAVKVGSRAVLIRGPSGAGKSRLAFDLILAGRSGQLPPTTVSGWTQMAKNCGPVRYRSSPA
jgi:excinuclease UvrABC ATPase subunit